MIPLILAALGGGLIANAIGSGKEQYADGGLIAPNGKKSKLTPEQYKLVRTPEFKAWFGDWEKDPKNASKVVDGNGDPLVVYHGSGKQFNQFEKQQQNNFYKNIDIGTLGFHFTNNKDPAPIKNIDTVKPFLAI